MFFSMKVTQTFEPDRTFRPPALSALVAAARKAQKIAGDESKKDNEEAKKEKVASRKRKRSAKGKEAKKAAKSIETAKIAETAEVAQPARKKRRRATAAPAISEQETSEQKQLNQLVVVTRPTPTTPELFTTHVFKGFLPAKTQAERIPSLVLTEIPAESLSDNSTIPKNTHEIISVYMQRNNSSWAITLDRVSATDCYSCFSTEALTYIFSQDWTLNVREKNISFSSDLVESNETRFYIVKVQMKSFTMKKSSFSTPEQNTTEQHIDEMAHILREMPSQLPIFLQDSGLFQQLLSSTQSPAVIKFVSTSFPQNFEQLDVNDLYLLATAQDYEKYVRLATLLKQKDPDYLSKIKPAANPLLALSKHPLNLPSSQATNILDFINKEQSMLYALLEQPQAEAFARFRLLQAPTFFVCMVPAGQIKLEFTHNIEPSVFTRVFNLEIQQLPRLVPQLQQKVSASTAASAATETKDLNFGGTPTLSLNGADAGAGAGSSASSLGLTAPRSAAQAAASFASSAAAFGSPVHRIAPASAAISAQNSTTSQTQSHVSQVRP